MKAVLLFIIGGSIVFTLFTQYTSPQKSAIDNIISLSPSHTQALDYLGLGDKIVAISSYDIDPNYQDRVKIAGGIYFDEEKVLALNPDLVIIGDIQRNSESVSFLESKGVQTLTIKTKSFQDIYQSLLDLQQLFPKIISDQTVSNYLKQWQELQNTPVKKRRSTFIISAVDPIYSISTNNYLNELYYYSGWDNIITTKTPYPIFNEEQLLSLPSVDDIIIPASLTNELQNISNIQAQLKAKNIVVISNYNVRLPSPYLLEIIKNELRPQQNSLFSTNNFQLDS